MTRLLASLLLLAALLLPGQGWAAGNVVQQKAAAVGASPRTVTLDGAVTAGNSLVVVLSDVSFDTWPGLGCNYSVTDNNSNTYTASTQYAASTNAQMCGRVYVKHVPALTTNPPTVTCTDSDGSGAVWCHVMEVSGLSNSAIDGSISGTSTSTTSLATSNLSTSATDFLIGVFANSTSSRTLSYGAGWTGVNIDNGASRQFLTEVKTGQAAGTYAATASLDVADDQWLGIIVALPEAAGGQTFGFRRRRAQ